MKLIKSKKAENLEFAALVNEAVFDTALDLRRRLDDAWTESKHLGLPRRELERQILKTLRKKF